MTSQPSWELLLGTPRPHDHFVQLYTDDGFFGRAVLISLARASGMASRRRPTRN